MSQVKFKADGQNVTVTVSATDSNDLEWDIFAYMNNYASSTDDYVSGKGMTITYNNADVVAVLLQQPDSVGSGVYLGASFKYSNGQWTLQYQ